ncbi:kinase-associated lipoprotein B [Metabacillus litoralis]|uniref:kinase-associated lipoprotein B n=1 Tax=Metabacillus TaxID=2675233 RepID=UPI00203C360B|nr:kinase-associated lipoprotein B [Metabacillus litoralis]MCM3161120.1 kinase-associated lipoprotein B [Metabacillus litoralis]MCM3413696.1 kinase-associated lipoprotein B [Metabacillus litoralis]
MEEMKIGDIVAGIYKTGKYIGVITDIKPMHYLVKVKAVLKHPQQGDLHNPKQVDVQFFHERRALAFNEQTNVPKQMVKRFEDEVPEYQQSLRKALDVMKKELEEINTDWAKESLTRVEVLEKDYFPY